MGTLPRMAFLNKFKRLCRISGVVRFDADLHPYWFGCHWTLLHDKGAKCGLNQRLFGAVG